MAKKSLLWFALLSIALIGGLVTAEVVLRLFYPQPHIIPRYAFSERYGLALTPSSTFVEELNGKWRFVYTIDIYGHRAPSVPISNRYNRQNIVLLGDSFAFGQGVNDGEEYASILRGKLDGRAGVVNLAVPGYGLTQEIRKYYEFGKLYDPAIVMVNFSGNDPDDGIMDPVTVVENGRFVFRPARPLGIMGRFAKTYLRDSIIQYSQVYNFLRTFGYRLLRSERTVGTPTPRKQAAYNRLLDLFARDLSAKGINLIFFGVNGHLQRFPVILDKVRELEQKGLLTYLESIPWFKNKRNYGSPEGHSWGSKAHRIVAERLFKVLQPRISGAKED